MLYRAKSKAEQGKAGVNMLLNIWQKSRTPGEDVCKYKQVGKNY